MAAVGAALTGLLFFGYLRVSWTVAATSDGAAQALQARDMLAGNWLLHGWTVSDVSFYTTELPQYVLVELVRPFGGVIHVAAAVTYTLLVPWRLRARAGPRAGTCGGLVRGLLAAGSCWHRNSGTERSSCCCRLITSARRYRCCSAGCCSTRAPPTPGGYPSLLCLVLAWVQFADRVVLVTAVLPLVMVCAVSALQGLLWRPAGRPEGTSGRGRALKSASEPGRAGEVGTTARVRHRAWRPRGSWRG